MRFHLNFEGFLSTLPVMLYGMLGGLVVMLILCGILMGLYQAGKTLKRPR